MKRVSDDEMLLNMAFPIRGIDQVQEHAAQPQDTTPIGRNVRVCDPGTLRLRGASRPGLSKHVSTQPGGANLIQHLDVIVDPTTEALGQPQSIPAGSDPDPRIPNSHVPQGGTGWQPNPNNPWPLDDDGDDDWEFVQAESEVYAVNAPGSTVNLSFASDVTAGNLLLVACENSDTTSSSYLDAVTDSQGNTYTRIHPVDGINGVMYRAIAGSSGPCEVNLAFVVGAGTLHTKPVILEYSGNHATPGDGSSSNSGNSTALSTGSMTVSQPSTLIVGVFFMGIITGVDPPLPAIAPDAGMNERFEETGISGPFELKTAVYDSVVDADAAVTATASSAVLFTACGGAFKPA